MLRHMRGTAGLSIALMLAASCGGNSVVPPQPNTPGTVRVVASPSRSVTTTQVVSNADVLAGLQTLEAGVVACFARPSTCDTSRLAAADSPALTYLDGLLQHYLTNDLVARQVQRGLRYVVPEHVDRPGPDRAVVTLCEVDGSWQMDRRGTDDPSDDAVFDDTLISRRARHELVRRGDRWLRWDVAELQLWIGENACPAPASS